MTMTAHAAQASNIFPQQVGGFFYTKNGKRTIDRRATLWGCKTKSGMATFVSRKDLGQFLAILSSPKGPRFLTQDEIEKVQEWVRKKRAAEPDPTPAPQPQMAAEASASAVGEKENYRAAASVVARAINKHSLDLGLRETLIEAVLDGLCPQTIAGVFAHAAQLEHAEAHYRL